MIMYYIQVYLEEHFTREQNIIKTISCSQIYILDVNLIAITGNSETTLEVFILYGFIKKY